MVAAVSRSILGLDHTGVPLTEESFVSMQGCLDSLGLPRIDYA